MTISMASGFPATSSDPNATAAQTYTIDITVVNSGDFIGIVCPSGSNSPTNPITSVTDSAGIVTWQSSEIVNNASGGSLCWWYGVSKGTGATTVSVNKAAADTSYGWVNAIELTDPNAGSWTIVASGSNTDSSGNTVNYASLTSGAQTDQAYIGQAAEGGSDSDNVTTGFTDFVDVVQSSLIYDLALSPSTAYAPTASQTGQGDNNASFIVAAVTGTNVSLSAPLIFGSGSAAAPTLSGVTSGPESISLTAPVVAGFSALSIEGASISVNLTVDVAAFGLGYDYTASSGSDYNTVVPIFGAGYVVGPTLTGTTESASISAPRIYGFGAESPNTVSVTAPLTITDNFTRSNSSSLGSNWTPFTATGMSGGMGISGDDAIGQAASGYTGDWYSGASWSANQSSMIDVTTPSSSLSQTGESAGVVVRADSTGLNMYAGVYYLNNGFTTLEISKLVGGGSWTQLASTTSVSNVFVNDTIELAVTGSDLTLYYSGTAVLTYTDTSITSGAPGVIAYGTPTLGAWTGTGATTASTNVSLTSPFVFGLGNVRPATQSSPRSITTTPIPGFGFSTTAPGQGSSSSTTTVSITGTGFVLAPTVSANVGVTYNPVVNGAYAIGPTISTGLNIPAPIISGLGTAPHPSLSLSVDVTYNAISAQQFGAGPSLGETAAISLSSPFISGAGNFPPPVAMSSSNIVSPFISGELYGQPATVSNNANVNLSAPPILGLGLQSMVQAVGVVNLALTASPFMGLGNSYAPSFGTETVIDVPSPAIFSSSFVPSVTVTTTSNFSFTPTGIFALGFSPAQMLLPVQNVDIVSSYDMGFGLVGSSDISSSSQVNLLSPYLLGFGDVVAGPLPNVIINVLPIFAFFSSYGVVGGGFTNIHVDPSIPGIFNGGKGIMMPSIPTRMS